MRVVIAVLLGVSIGCTAQAAPLVGRVFDSVEGLVFSDATVSINGLPNSARTDRFGYFNLVDVVVGSHRFNILLADGRRLACQVLISSNASSVLAEFDVSRIVPPDEDDDY